MVSESFVTTRPYGCNSIWVKKKDTVEWTLTPEQVNVQSITIEILGGDEPYIRMVPFKSKDKTIYHFEKNRFYIINLMAGKILLANCSMGPQLKPVAPE